MATNGFSLVYLEIGDGVLTEVSRAQLDYGISCLDINPIGERADHSLLAAVGMWRDFSVRIFVLPDLQLVAMEHLGEFVPRSVLLCVFEGVYLCLSFLSFYSCLDSFSVILLITIISSYLRSIDMGKNLCMSMSDTNIHLTQLYVSNNIYLYNFFDFFFYNFGHCPYISETQKLKVEKKNRRLLILEEHDA